ncbi:hypothetical protein LTR27_000533 [Elasticomyces elasticus]|nr:hypothetical protein LTR27_000533 [Elasticomyces elasticus]
MLGGFTPSAPLIFPNLISLVVDDNILAPVKPATARGSPDQPVDLAYSSDDDGVASPSTVLESPDTRPRPAGRDAQTLDDIDADGESDSTASDDSSVDLAEDDEGYDGSDDDVGTTLMKPSNLKANQPFTR